MTRQLQLLIVGLLLVGAGVVLVVIGAIRSDQDLVNLGFALVAGGLAPSPIVAPTTVDTTGNEVPPTGRL